MVAQHGSSLVERILIVHAVDIRARPDVTVRIEEIEPVVGHIRTPRVAGRECRSLSVVGVPDCPVCQRYGICAPRIRRRKGNRPKIASAGGGGVVQVVGRAKQPPGGHLYMIVASTK